MNIMTKPDFKWTDENVTLLIALKDQGHTRAEIAKRLGTGKNSVVGKLNRLGLSHSENNPIIHIPKADRALFITLWRSGKPLAEIAKQTGMSTDSAVEARARNWGLPTRKAIKRARPKGVRVRPTRMVNKDRRVEFEPHDGPGCQFIHGEPADRDFCGAPTKELDQNQHSPYCEHHHERAYVPQRKAKEQDAA